MNYRLEIKNDVMGPHTMIDFPSLEKAKNFVKKDISLRDPIIDKWFPLSRYRIRKVGRIHEK